MSWGWVLTIFFLYSQDVTSQLVDQVVAGHADDVIEMKEKVEEMWRTSYSQRVRRTSACKGGIPGFSLFADNVGVYRFKIKGHQTPQ